MIMEAVEKIISTFDASAGASALGTHQFPDDFALAYHLAVAERLRERPDAVVEHARQNLNRWLEGDFSSSQAAGPA